jgi:hypothetical protein
MYLVPAQASTQPALASYLSGHAGSGAAPNGLFVLAMAGQQIQAVTRFLTGELYPRFGLPLSLPA